MKTQFSKDVQRLQFEMEFRNYSPRSIKNYCFSMHLLENRTDKALNLVSPEYLKTHNINGKQKTYTFKNRAIIIFHHL